MRDKGLDEGERDALVEFLHSRLGEDAARVASPRAAADVAAQARIIEHYRRYRRGTAHDDMVRTEVLEDVMLDLAAVHATHPDFRDAWSAEAPQGT